MSYKAPGGLGQGVRARERTNADDGVWSLWWWHRSPDRVQEAERGKADEE